jgi:predicted metal-dependent phosphoesterase TrpH
VRLPVLGRIGPECYSEPLAVFGLARRRGMSLVTLTDHDSIEGGLEIAHLPGTFLSEEVTCGLPGGRELHLGVFGLDERQHLQIQRRRDDAEALLAYLAEQQLPACVNHLFSALTGRRELQDLHLPFGRLDLIEVRNGALPATSNDYAEQARCAMGLAAVAGSDGHTLPSVARAYTEVPGSRDVGEFLAGLSSGWTVPRGRAGSYATLTAEISLIAVQSYRHIERHATDDLASLLRFVAALLALPALPLIPFVTAGLHLRERVFARRWFHRFWESRVPSARRQPGLALAPRWALEAQR